MDAIPEEKRPRLVQTLGLICCKQVEAESSSKIPLNSFTPWLLLHYVLLRYKQVYFNMCLIKCMCGVSDLLCTYAAVIVFS